ncbi:hypothetical protein BGX30_006719 [Mortierella sp. GBA39]|nr:hypothetical protein BGX30_006719 [Mortierella sp. GBA39]
MYHRGRGFPQDYAKAEEWLLKAAKHGRAHAQQEIGAILEQGTYQSHIKAVEWLRMSVEQGHVTAQFQLGNAYINRKGVAMDIDTAMDWLRQAEEQGHE